MYRGNFGTIVRTLRKEQGWSQAMLAEQVDLDPSTISKIEQGEMPHSANADRIIKALGEKHFYAMYTMGAGYESYNRRTSLRNQFFMGLRESRFDVLEQALVEFKKEVDSGNTADMQLLLTMQQLWCQANGVSMDRTRTFLEIFKMGRDIELDPKSQKIHIPGEKLSIFEQYLLNYIGISYMQDGQSDQAKQIFEWLFVELKGEVGQDGKARRKLATISNNWAMSCLETRAYDQAAECCNYAIFAALKDGSPELMLTILRTKEKILKGMGRMEEAAQLDRFLNFAGILFYNKQPQNVKISQKQELPACIFML